MQTLKQIRKKVKELSKIIDAPKHSIPTFGYSEQSGLPHIEITETEYHFVVCERKTEYERKKTADLNEILFWIFDSMTFSIACRLELQNRKGDEDFRIQAFQIQEDLISKIDPEFSMRLKIKHDKLLRK